jgi:prepilin-type N-terminal cleavage/methylation domain-containing protein
MYTISDRLNSHKKLIAENDESGVTLIEILIAIVAIGIVVAIVLSFFTR